MTLGTKALLGPLRLVPMGAHAVSLNARISAVGVRQ